MILKKNHDLRKAAGHNSVPSNKPYYCVSGLLMDYLLKKCVDVFCFFSNIYYIIIYIYTFGKLNISQQRTFSKAWCFGSELACVHSSIQSSAATISLSAYFNWKFLRLWMKSSFGFCIQFCFLFSSFSYEINKLITI